MTGKMNMPKSLEGLIQDVFIKVPCSWVVKLESKHRHTSCVLMSAQACWTQVNLALDSYIPRVFMDLHNFLTDTKQFLCYFCGLYKDYDDYIHRSATIH